MGQQPCLRSARARGTSHYFARRVRSRLFSAISAGVLPPESSQRKRLNASVQPGCVTRFVT